MRCNINGRSTGSFHAPWPSFTVSIVWLVAIIVVLCVPPAKAQNVNNILVLHSYHQGLQWTDRISEGIQAELQSYKNGLIEVHFEYLDTKRNAGEAYYELLVEFERQKTQLANLDFKLIIASDNNALRFMMEYGKSLFPDVPIVFCGVNNFHPAMLDGHDDVTGVVESIDYAATLELMLNLHRQRKHILVILDRTPTGNAIKDEFQKVSAKYAEHFQFEYYQDFTLEEVPARISKLDDDYLIYLLTFNRDRKGRFISYADGINMIRQAARVPIYGSWEFYFGNGIVGGMITSGYSQGLQAGRLSKDILDGRSAEKIPFITQSPNRYMFDYLEMRRYGIKKSQLPPSSIIIHEPPSFYVRHKKLIISTLAMTLSIMILLSWRLLVNRHRQRRLEASNLELDRRVAEQTLALQEKNEQLEAEAQQLETALVKVKTLSGMLPICANCKKIRDDNGYWNQIEQYIHDHSEAEFSHGICPECARALYPELNHD